MKIGVRLFTSIILVILNFSCAKRASPTGGPKDSIPPILTNASPKLNTTYFNKTGFTLTFDEYISLNEISKQLVISPPLNPNQYKVLPASGASKKISLELKDSLLDNTTYTFNFGNSVVDFNESNTLPFLTYTISTGPIIDTLYIRGTVVDAFEKEKWKLDEDYIPENANKKYGGELTLVEGLAKSKNTVSAYLMKRVGPRKVIKLARKMGITSYLPAVPSLCLGTAEISLLFNNEMIHQLLESNSNNM